MEAAARQCGLSERTVYNRLEDAEFKKRLNEIRADMAQRSSGMLTAAAGEAVRTLLALQKEATPAAVRLGAARAILEVGMKIRQMVDLEMRLAELEELVANNLYRKTAQVFAVLLPIGTVGVMGDARSYDSVIAIRAVESQDFMTADWARIPFDVLATMSNRIINEVRGVNRVVYDISSKPPATIEWE